ISGPAPIEREQPFTRLKPTVERLVNMQLKLCNRLISEAKPVVENDAASADERQDAYRKLLQVKVGHPKNKQLLRVLENPAARKALDKIEIEMNSDLQKTEMFKLKEELF